MTSESLPSRDGLILVDKPAGPTSHDIVATLRRTLGIRRAGHAGTLDPFATGLLTICLGRATRLVRFVAGGPKDYEGTIRIGLSTDTDDITGRPLGDPAQHLPDLGDVRAAAAKLVGTQAQTPPSYSAKKIGGKPAYRRARRGHVVRLEPVNVTVHHLDILDAPPGADVMFRASVSPGTYLRALARDLGELLGTGGCLAALRRTRSGAFCVEDAISPDSDADTLANAIIPMDRVPLGLPDLVVDGTEAERLRSGGDLRRTAECAPEGPLRLLDPDGRLLAIGLAVTAADGGRSIHPEVVLRPAVTGPDSFTPQEDM